MAWSPRPKYRNVKTELDGYSFASKLEAAVYAHLKMLALGGEIKDIKCQTHVFLTEARIEMIPDFSAVTVRTDELFYIEAKGLETDVWRLKRKLWKVYGPGKLDVYKGSERRVYLHESIIPKLL